MKRKAFTDNEKEEQEKNGLRVLNTRLQVKLISSSANSATSVVSSIQLSIEVSSYTMFSPSIRTAPSISRLYIQCIVRNNIWSANSFGI